MVKYKLYHFPLCPFSRKVRLFANEKNIKLDLANENFWDRRPDFLALNPTGQVPLILNYENSTAIRGSLNICEYLEESNNGTKFIGDNPESKAEIINIVNWFDEKFYDEVSFYILNERLLKFYKKKTGTNLTPNPHYVRAARVNLTYHLEYIDFLLKRTKWLAANKITLADFAAASHLSVIDYFGDINWSLNESVKEWYSLLKSRPCFQSILNDHISGYNPVSNYANLDF
jgi:glutathione S-transferase